MSDEDKAAKKAAKAAKKRAREEKEEASDGDDQLVPRTATSKICGNKWPVRNLLKDLSRSHLCFENSFDLSYKICHL